MGTKLPSGSVGPGGQRHLHLAGAQVYLLLPLVFQQPQGRGHLRPRRHPRFTLLPAAWSARPAMSASGARHRLRLLHHHQPRQWLQHRLRPLPVPDRQRRPVGEPGPADRLRGFHRPVQRQPLPLRDPVQRPLPAAPELLQEITGRLLLHQPSSTHQPKGGLVVCLLPTLQLNRAISPKPS